MDSLYNKAHLKKIDLLDGSFLKYDKSFFPMGMALKLFHYMKDNLPWKQEQTKYAPFPRLTAWLADKDLKYSYSGVTHVGEGWNETMAFIKEQVENAAETTFNSLLVNYYRDGKDSIGYHTDAEPELGENPIVSSMTFLGLEEGKTKPRDFKLKHKKGAKHSSLTIPLEHGSLLVMCGTTQEFYLHGVEKTKDEAIAPRINLTFRKILT